MVAQIAVLAEELETGFEKHPDAEVVRSLPGLGTVLGARVLGEFGDEPNRYGTAKSRKNYAGTRPSPEPRAPNASCWPATRATSAGRRHLPMGLRYAHRLTRSPSLLRHPPSCGRHPPRRSESPRQPPCRHPPRCLEHHTIYDEIIAGHTATARNFRKPLDNATVGCLGGLGRPAGQGGHGPVGGLGRAQLVGAEQVGHDPQHPLHQAAAAHARWSPGPSSARAGR